MTPTLDRLRILIALAVLRNTPVDQTHCAYILSLRESFPSSEAPLDFWKCHARRLEQECIELRAALEKLQFQSFIDTHASSTQPAEFSESSIPSSSDHNDLLVKKSKKKSDPTAEMEAVKLTEILRSGRIGIRLGRPFEAMDRFLQLWSLSTRPAFPRKAFFTVTRDVCKAVSSAFEDATRERTNLNALQVVQAIICAVVDKAVPLVLSWITEHDEALSLLFDNLLDLLIIPIIPAFLVVSERNLSYMRNADSSDSPASNSADYVDGRVSILALLQKTFSHIQSALFISTNQDSGGESHSPDSLALAHAEFSVMIHSFILAIVRHLREILREGDTTHKQKPTRRRRIKRLAVKDTFWYLCSTVHFLLDLQGRSESIKEFSRQQHRLELLNQTTLATMVDLVLYQDRKRSVNCTERHNLPPSKTLLQGSVEHQALSHASTLDNDTGVKEINYLVLDDMGYRMLLGLLERFLGGA